jgi:CRISPR-associated protein Cmr1
MTQSAWHNLTITTITPAFFGKFAAMDQTRAQIPFPVPSLRGALAYWLRALAGAHVGDNLSSLLKAESAVFGSARSGNSGGPSTLWIRGPLIGVNQFTPSSPHEAYLLGPGLRDTKAPAARHLRAGATINLAVRNTGGSVHADLFLSALWALRTFGGIGARARRGFGTITVDDRPLRLPCERFMVDWLYRNSADDLQDVLSCVGASLDELGIPRNADDNNQPGYPRFDLSRKWYLLQSDIAVPDAQNALAWTGERLREFRLDGDAHENTEGYRKIVRPYLDGAAFDTEFRAGALGLPVVYTEKATRPEDEGRSATVEPVVDGQSSRRASPLWLRVHRNRSAWWLRSLAFNAVWLPETGAELRIKSTKGPNREPQPVLRPSPDVIRQELDRWFAHVSSQSPA